MRTIIGALGRAALLGLLAMPVQAAEILVNGGFETGDFTGWTQVTSNTGIDCQNDWTVTAADTFCNYVNTTLNAPPEGSFAALNSFDGGGPLSYIIEQDLTLDSGVLDSATLSWQESLGWDFSLGDIATEQRIFSLTFEDSTDTTIGTAYEIMIGPDDGVTNFIDWTAMSADVASILAGYEGQQVTLVAEIFVPQNFTGPATLGLDAISLDVEISDFRNPIPEPASGTLFGVGAIVAGLATRRRLS